ncbi:RNF115.2 family protein [Megaselia abdita]
MDCIICREDIRINGTGSCIPCGHIYHAECLIPWLKSHQSCPICRMKSTIDDLQILQIDDEEKKDGLPNDEIHTIAKLVEKAKEENSFVIVNPTNAEFPYIPPNNVEIERGLDVTESTETIVRHHRRRVIQAVIGYLLLVALILLIAFIARNSVNDNK